VRVESKTPISADVLTHDNDTSDAKCEPVVESTLTIFNYPSSSQPLEFLL